MTTATITRLSYEELIDLVVHEFGSEAEAKFQIDDFISAGYGILVYSNHDLGHPSLGERVFLKYGFGCTIQEIPANGTSCPVTLPDGRMSWRYYIDGAYHAIKLDLESS